MVQWVATWERVVPPLFFAPFWLRKLSHPAINPHPPLTFGDFLLAGSYRFWPYLKKMLCKCATILRLHYVYQVNLSVLRVRSIRKSIYVAWLILVRPVKSIMGPKVFPQISRTCQWISTPNLGKHRREECCRPPSKRWTNVPYFAGN